MGTLYSNAFHEIQALRRHVDGCRNACSTALGVRAQLDDQLVGNVERILSDLEIRHVILEKDGSRRTTQAIMVANTLRLQHPELDIAVVVPEEVCSIWRTQIETLGHSVSKPIKEWEPREGDDVSGSGLGESRELEELHAEIESVLLKFESVWRRHFQSAKRRFISAQRRRSEEDALDEETLSEAEFLRSMGGESKGEKSRELEESRPLLELSLKLDGLRLRERRIREQTAVVTQGRVYLSCAQCMGKSAQLSPSRFPFLIVDSLLDLSWDLRARIAQDAGRFAGILLLSSPLSLLETSQILEVLSVVEPVRVGAACFDLAASSSQPYRALSLGFTSKAKEDLLSVLEEGERARPHGLYRQFIGGPFDEACTRAPQRRSRLVEVLPTEAESLRVSAMKASILALEDKLCLEQEQLLFLSSIGGPSLDAHIESMRSGLSSPCESLDTLQASCGEDAGSSMLDALCDLLNSIWLRDSRKAIVVACADRLTAGYVAAAISTRLDVVGVYAQTVSLRVAVSRQVGAELERRLGELPESICPTTYFSGQGRKVLVAVSCHDLDVNPSGDCALVLFGVLAGSGEAERWIRLLGMSAQRGNRRCSPITVHVLTIRGLATLHEERGQPKPDLLRALTFDSTQAELYSRTEREDLPAEPELIFDSSSLAAPPVDRKELALGAWMKRLRGAEYTIEFLRGGGGQALFWYNFVGAYSLKKDLHTSRALVGLKDPSLLLKPKSPEHSTVCIWRREQMDSEARTSLSMYFGQRERPNELPLEYLNFGGRLHDSLLSTWGPGNSGRANAILADSALEIGKIQLPEGHTLLPTCDPLIALVSIGWIDPGEHLFALPPGAYDLATRGADARWLRSRLRSETFCFMETVEVGGAGEEPTHIEESLAWDLFKKGPSLVGKGRASHSKVRMQSATLGAPFTADHSAVLAHSRRSIDWFEAEAARRWGKLLPSFVTAFDERIAQIQRNHLSKVTALEARIAGFQSRGVEDDAQYAGEAQAARDELRENQENLKRRLAWLEESRQLAQVPQPVNFRRYAFVLLPSLNPGDGAL